MKNRKIFFLLIPLVAASIMLSGCKKSTQPTATAAVQQVKDVTYSGQDGKTVYDILKETHNVDASTSSMGVLVKSIDGVSQTDKEFWLYDVNGTESNVGADQQMTKSTDVIHWQLKGF